MSKKTLIKSLICTAALMSGAVAFADNRDVYTQINKNNTCAAVVNDFANSFTNFEPKLFQQITNQKMRPLLSQLIENDNLSLNFNFSCTAGNDGQIKAIHITASVKADPTKGNVILSLEVPANKNVKMNQMKYSTARVNKDGHVVEKILHEPVESAK